MESKQTSARRRIVHILATLDPTDRARKLALLLAHLPRGEFDSSVVALAAGSGLMRDQYASIGIPVEALATGRRLALLEIVSLAQRLRRQTADLIQLWHDDIKPITALSARVAGRTSRLITDQLPVGVEADRVAPNRSHWADPSLRRQQFLAEVGFPPHARLIGTIDELDHASRLTEILWATDQMRCVRDDVYLVVAGDGPQRPLFERYAALYRIDEHVRFLGWQARPEALLSHLDLYCTAAGRQSIPLSLLEAMANGLPVVAADTRAHREAVVPRQTGFLVDLHVRSELARWCLKVIEDEQLAASMSGAARQRVREAFPLERFTSGYRDLYRSTLGRAS